MHKRRQISNSKKSTGNVNENIASLNASISTRFSKSSRLQAKAVINEFQIRKPLNIYMTEELEALGRNSYFQRVFVLAQNINENQCSDSYLRIPDTQQPDFCEYVQRHLDAIFIVCEKKKSTADHLSGLYIAIGTSHSLLMIEGAEDMVANFFEELEAVLDKFWSSSRVFLVEDKIGATYFNRFYYRYSAAINVNEKFPPSTPHEYNLMAVQHLKIKEKVKNVVETLSNQITKFSLSDDTRDSFKLPADPFNKLLPEIQRIDLVLAASKFYRTVKDFSMSYRVLQTHQDEDSFLWPIQNNYTPLDIFKRSEFDVNLTFGHYGKEEKKENEENTSQHNEEGSENI